MRVLFVCDTNCENPFALTLANALNKQGIDAACSTSDLFEGAKDYDIVHFQWPEAVYNWSSSLSKEQVEKVEQLLTTFKQEGKRIVITCHNLKPHTIKDENVCALYDVIYRHCDIFLHMGEYSRELLLSQYPEAKHVILPHHIYDELYSNLPTREEACSYLDINPAKQYILCLGKFRTDEEKQLLEFVAKHLPKNTAIIAPSFGFKSGKRFSCNWFKYHIKKSVIFANRIIAHRGYVNDKDVAYYMAASSVTLIQRFNILNSGNYPLGMFAGNVIVGPDTGNIGHYINETGNFTFNPKDISSIPSLIYKAFKSHQEGLGDRNKQYALSHWSSEVIAKRLIEIYKK